MLFDNLAFAMGGAAGNGGGQGNPLSAFVPVSYTHLTLPTNREV